MFVQPLYSDDGSWNQYNQTSFNGIARSSLKFSAGIAQDTVASQKPLLITGQFEYLVSDYMGLLGSTAYMVSYDTKDVFYTPALLGMNFHFFPRSVLDLYVGGKAGFVQIAPPGFAKDIFSQTSLQVGLSYYYWGYFFFELEGRYSFFSYAKDVAIELNGSSAEFRIGFYF